MDSCPPETTHWDFPGYDREAVSRAWEQAASVEGNDAVLWRKDAFGAWIYRLDYGNRNSIFGWEIFDSSLARPGSIAPLRPLQWQNYLDALAAETQSRVTADGLRNLRKLL